MSIRIPSSAALGLDEPRDDEGGSSSGSDVGDDDQTWDDWVSDSAQQPCKSLFDDQVFRSAEECLAHDKAKHEFDLDQTCSKLSLDIHGRIRLINFIRTHKPSSSEVALLKGNESFFTSEKYLLPALEDDPLLQTQSDDWSDSDVDEPSNPEQHIKLLQKRLDSARKDFSDYRAFVSQKLDLPALREVINEPSTSQPKPRDDDTHYFDSYAANDIHAVMIQDKVRTATYASFILTTPTLFQDAVVLDVGCGTGILSLFAARAGAKRVIAVDASDIAEKAEKIVKANGFEDIITVIRGKVEDITLPDGIEHVDIIISEWMGYALLYESMLDSVLRARDRFLKPDAGVMAPSQCQMMFGLCDASEIYKDRIGFWNDVYGFDLSTMADGIYEDAIVDVVGPETLLSEPYVIKDLLTNEITQRQLDFTSSFRLVSTSERRTKINSFILYFDTFFSQTGSPIGPSTKVKVVKEEDAVVAEVWPVGGRPAPQRRQSLGKEKEKIVSFSTGPLSIPTHWKQTLFMLRDPISVAEGSIVSGSFHCKKSETNSRELDVEIHYSVQDTPESPVGETVVQMFKVR
ncbi:hypothetical protein HGRIS_005602 [Hohenbuehelia grisea]|uniref:type I protein arginine methyltransferase n=1 Tax=Hohenbuehelia grisea TaxID=104357 RepID=A0ABR3JZD5_9AGAR